MKAKNNDRAQALKDNMARRKAQARTRDQDTLSPAKDGGVGGAAAIRGHKDPKS